MRVVSMERYTHPLDNEALSLRPGNKSEPEERDLGGARGPRNCGKKSLDATEKRCLVVKRAVQPAGACLALRPGQ